MSLNKLLNLKVFSVHHEGAVANITGVLFNRKNLGLEVILTSYDDQILLVNNIRELNDKGIVIDSLSSLTHTSDLVRWESIASSTFKPRLLTVRTVSGTKLGKVVDTQIDTNHQKILKFLLRPTWKIRLKQTNLIIDQRQVIRIDKNTLIVNDNYAEAKIHHRIWETSPLSLSTAEPSTTERAES